MKKLLPALLLLSILATSAGAEVIGALSKLNATEAQFAAATVQNSHDTNTLSALFTEKMKHEKNTIRFYNSIAQMQMALSRGEVDSLALSDIVGKYLLRQSDEYNLHGVILFKTPIALSLGMLAEKSELRDRLSGAIRELEAEGMIGILGRDFITGPKAMNPPAVEFANFDGAETITVGVTGDMPPLDYIAADGTPSGFNTALMAEIGKKLRVNVRLINIETEARASALVSGRADVVFWFMIYGHDMATHDMDAPEGLIFSKPYFGFSEALLVGKK